MSVNDSPVVQQLKVMRGIHSERVVNRCRVVLLFAAVLVLASCVNRGGATKATAPVTPAAPKPVAKAPAPAAPVPQPLSIPQTHVALPPPQPIDPAALATESVSQDAQQPTTRPAAGPRRVTTAPPPATPAPVAVEPPRNPIIQEMIPSAELKRLQDQAQGRRREVNQLLEQLSKRSLPHTQQGVVKSIVSFLALSEEAEKRNDMRQADALAERAQILARDLQNGK